MNVEYVLGCEAINMGTAWRKACPGRLEPNDIEVEFGRDVLRDHPRVATALLAVRSYAGYRFVFTERPGIHDDEVCLAMVEYYDDDGRHLRILRRFISPIVLEAALL